MRKFGLIGALALGIGVVSVVIPAQAKSKTTYITSNVSYVRTKKALYFGASEKTKTGYKKVTVKKNTLLRVEAIYGNNSGTSARFSFGAVHYARNKNIKYNTKVSVPLTTANFTVAKLKAPVRTIVLRPGHGYALAGQDNLSYTSAFYLTLDNYIQYYSKATMKKVNPNPSLEVYSTDLWKPTKSVKITKVTTKGKTYTVDYKTPISGLPNKKIAKNHYRLVIKDLKTKGSDGNDIHLASWENYTVNGKAFFAGEVYGNDGNED